MLTFLIQWQRQVILTSISFCHNSYMWCSWPFLHSQLFVTGCMCWLLVSSLVCESVWRSLIPLLLSVGVHAVSLMTPDVACHCVSDYFPASQSRHSDSFQKCFQSSFISVNVSALSFKPTRRTFSIAGHSSRLRWWPFFLKKKNIIYIQPKGFKVCEYSYAFSTKQSAPHTVDLSKFGQIHRSSHKVFNHNNYFKFSLLSFLILFLNHYVIIK